MSTVDTVEVLLDGEFEGICTLCEDDEGVVNCDSCEKERLSASDGGGKAFCKDGNGGASSGDGVCW